MINFVVSLIIIYCAIVNSLQTKGPVTVIGGSGRVGREIVKKLTSQGIETRCLIRDVTKLKDDQDYGGVSFTKGDVGDLNALIAVTKGAQAVIDCHGVSPPRVTKLVDIVRHPRHALNSPYCINFLGTKRLLAAMEINAVPKLVRVTGALTGKSPFLLPVALFNMILSMTCKWHERSEIAIRESGIDYTLLRPTGIRAEADAKSQGRSLVFIPGDSKEKLPLPGKISVKDVAALCVDSVGEPRMRRATAIISSREGAGGVSLWAPLIAAKAAPDTTHVRRRWHELPVVLYSGVFVALATAMLRLVVGVLISLRMKLRLAPA